MDNNSNQPTVIEPVSGKITSDFTLGIEDIDAESEEGNHPNS